MKQVFLLQQAYVLLIANTLCVLGYTPFHFAACWGHKDCLKILVQNGAEVDLRTKYGETPRQLAVRYKHSDCISYIDWAGRFSGFPQTATVV